MRLFVTPARLSGPPLPRLLRSATAALASLALALFLVAGCGGDGGDDGGEADTTADAVTPGDVSGADGQVPDGAAPDAGGGDDVQTTDATPAGPVVIVTELMPNPCVVSDTDGEWFEVTNVTTEAVDINGWTIRDEGGDDHVIAHTGPLVVEPGLSLVLAANGDDTANGGVTADYVYDGITMTNSGGDQIILVDLAGEVVDAVAYTADQVGDLECAALQLSSDRYTAEDNDDPEAWCAAVAPYGTGDNFGTPGGANAICVIDRCGDGVVDTDLGEECDLGADNSDTAPDTCRENCLDPWCGDGVTDPGNDEACDDGEDNSDTEPDACRSDCSAPSCGDGVVDTGLGEQCDDGPDGSDLCTSECRLVGEPPPAQPGDVFFTEIMRNSADSQDMGEWVELHNPTVGLFSLEGCILRDDEGDSHTIVGPLQIDAGGYVVLARSDDDTETGGLVADYVYDGFRLGNTADQAILECFGTVIDEVRYTDAEAWPDDAAFAMSLSITAYGHVENDDAASWCSARDEDPYGDGTNYGTPGAENPPCGDIEAVDWCRLQSPPALDVDAGAEVTVYGRVREAGVTDATPGIDPSDALVGQVGYGADGSDPATDAAWTWLSAIPNPDWDGTAAGETDNDEYVATFAAPAPGTYDYAYRFSADGGATWTVCDLDGSDNGYDAAQAGAMTTAASPCFPDPCTEPPADECDADGVTVRAYGTDGTCTPTGADTYECDWPVQTFDCSLLGGTCQDGQCVGTARTPAAAGELVITELLNDAEGVDDGKEWFELRNTTADWLALDGCVISEEGESHAIEGETVLGRVDLGVVAVPPGAWFVLAQSDDLETNGGVVADYVYGLDVVLGNTNDTLAITCDGVVIDAVAYDAGAGWPDETGAALSLEPTTTDAAANDDPVNWCAASEPYGDGTNLGSPGAENPPCAGDTEVDWCRYQWPLDQESPAGTTFTAYGRVYDQGITDLTTGVDTFDGLVGQAGYGPDGSDPSVDATDWVWFDASANPGWDGAAAGEAHNDEYQADILTPAAGDYDLAYRFSLDGGETWTYCDDGDAGSSDGYAAADAGALVATTSPCETTVCDTPDAPECQDAATLIVYTAPGTCEVVDGQAVCSYPSETVDCTALGGTCQDGVCVGGARPPVAGEVIFTEVLYDAVGELGESDAEWFELTNLTGDEIALNGCTVTDAGGNDVTIGTLLVAANATALFVRSDDTALNGGLTPDVVFDFSVNNTDETLTLVCAGVTIDAIAYDEGAGWPAAVGASLSLDPGAYDADANDLAESWCLAVDAYYDGTTPDDTHYGTPGVENPVCPVIDTEVDWCRLQWPLDATVLAGATIEVYGRVWDEGLTDQTVGVDEDPLLVGQAGVGPDGSDPSVDDTGWIWVDAAPNPVWDGSLEGEPENDEYVATFAAPSAGTYDHAYRFSLDGGLTWLYCDRDAGAGSDGAEDGYQAANAGSLVTEPSPCDPNPCTEPPAAVCDPDGVTRITYLSPGDCTVDGVDAVCDYPTETFDCSATGGTCADGACVGGAVAPVAGDLIVSEIMFDTGGPIAEDVGEWIELYNTAAVALLLDGCTVGDAGGATAGLDGLTVAPDGYLLLARSADTATNGGLTPDATFDFALNNGGDVITIDCGGTIIDTVDYGQATFPDQSQYALSLDPDAHDAALNDDGLNWCLAADVYFAGAAVEEEHYGTPAAANPDCPVVDTEVDWCRYQWPLDETAAEGASLDVYGRLWDEGLTDLTTGVDFAPGLVAEAGFGPDGSDPSVDDTGWTWVDADGTPDWDGSAVGEPENDEYVATIPLLPAGTFDLAYRFSLDGGATWLYCDRDAGVGSDGAEDGYQPANAGSVVVTDDPCVPNPCVDAPADECASATLLNDYEAPGVCTPDGGSFTCDYPPTVVDCSAGGGTCEAGACVGGILPPAPGDVIVTEVMYDSESPLTDGDAEWFELVNVSDAAVTLDGCAVEDGAPTTTSISGLTLDPGAVALFVRSDVAAANGGLVPDHLFDAGLNNGGDTIVLRCGDTVIDTITYDDGFTFPNGQAVAIALDSGQFDAAANDDGANWCLARSRYYEGATPDEDHYGTPGETNPPCDSVVDWCRYQWPTDETGVAAGTPVTLYGRVYEAGITDISAATDENRALWASAGFGPDGSDPSVDDTGWTWTPAIPNATWDGPSAGEADNDEYEATIAAPEPGTYDLAYRFSLDGGRTWLYCDGGPEGAGNGYDPANAGNLETVAGAIEPLFFSEYLEGSSNNKALEIYNAGAGPVLLSSCEVRLYSNGDLEFGTTVTLDAVELAAGDVFVVCHPSIALGTPADYCDQFGSLFYNGNDAIELNCQGTTMDIIGRIGEDPGAEWLGSTSDPAAGTQNDTLVRSCDVTEGDTVGDDVFDPDTEWTSLGVDVITGLGAHCAE